MEDKSNSNLDFFELTNNGKVVASESKIKWLFIRNYTIISLVFFTIYKIIFNISDMKFLDVFNESFQWTNRLVMADIPKFVSLLINRSYTILISSIIIILCSIIYTFVSSILIFKKYKIKKNDKKNIMKAVAIIQLIIFLVLMFDISVAYINQTKTCNDWKPIIQKIIDKSSNTEVVNYNADNYVNKVYTTNITQFFIILLINICYSIFCFKCQEKIVDKNCI